jgi:acyl-CoA synthetase (AMP-forming)/AMP-acid ligase II
VSASNTASLFDGLIRRGARLFTTRTAYGTGSETATYEALERAVREVADCLFAAGVRQGDRVLLLEPPSFEFVASFLATAALGAVAVPLATSSSADRVAYVVELTSPRVVCVRGTDGTAPTGLASIVLTFDFGAGRFSSPTPATVPATLPPLTGVEAAVILFSSGSSGRPKGVVLTHRHLLTIANTLSTVYGFDSDHRDLIIAPMAHSDGLQRVLSTLSAGGTVVSTSNYLSPGAMLEILPKHGITGFFMPTPLLRLLMRSAPTAFRDGTTTLRSIEFGSAAIAANEFAFLADAIPSARIYYHYGLTECSRAVILDVRAHPDKLATVGRAAPGVSIRICNDEGNDLGPGEEGQIWLRGEQLTTGYFKLDELNRERFRDGWLLTGDYGTLDADSFLSLHGRRDDMITSAGFHFFPAEAELELGPVPGAVQYLIAGVTDPTGLLAQVPWAFVVPQDPSKWEAHEFLAYARTRLPSYMIPRAAIALSALPLSASGKPDRRRTVEMYGRARSSPPRPGPPSSPP